MANTWANTTYSRANSKSFSNGLSSVLTAIAQSASSFISSFTLSAKTMTFNSDSSADISRKISISYFRVYGSWDMNNTTADLSFKIDFGPCLNHNEDYCTETT